MSLELINLQYNVLNRSLILPFSHLFEQGKMYAVMGLNGSGKTTLLKLLAGIWEKTSGKILWNDQDVSAMERKERSQLITFVPHNPHIYFDYTVRDIVKMGGYAFSLINLEHLVDQALIEVGLMELEDRLITRTSSGEKQRAYIARALVTQSPILLLDEPTASLDVKQCSSIWNLLCKLRSQGKIVIVATHDLPSIDTYCDEILYIDKGYCSISQEPALTCYEQYTDS
ncbi:MAG: ABC transporter ATP-binding protein [Chlamydiota bacterium]